MERRIKHPRDPSVNQVILWAIFDEKDPCLEKTYNSIFITKNKQKGNKKKE